jgi:ABC-type bacteriocin/lantibiotic exporter with double-glycine peptidase domain
VTHTRLAIGVWALLAAGCYAGSARSFSPERFQREPGWISVAPVRAVHQRGEKDCGAAVVSMLLGYWGVPVEQADVRGASEVAADRGLSARFLRDYLRARGLQAFLMEGSMAAIEAELAAGRPVLVGIAKPYSNQDYAHYQLVVGMHRERGRIVVVDPADGWQVYDVPGFEREWRPTQYLMIVASR